MSYLRMISTLAAITVAAAILAPVRDAAAGTVVTAAARQEGKIELDAGTVKAGAAQVKWADVLVAFNDEFPGVAVPPEVLHLRNGESWAGDIVKVAGEQAAINTPLFGKREFPSAMVKAIDFKPGLPPIQAGEEKMLYRTRGSPVPGSVLWVEGEKVALETPLGVLALTRKEITRAVCGLVTNAVAAPAANSDEIALADGTILSCEVTPSKDGLVVKHPVLGSQVLKPDSWRWVRRHRDNVVYLADTKPVSVVATPLIRRAPPAPRVEPSRGTEKEGAMFARRMYAWPKTVSEYMLPGVNGRKTIVSAVVSLAAGSRGDAVVRFRVGEKTAFESVLKQEKPGPVAVSFEAEAGSRLAIEVDFDKVLRFPCSVTVDDAVAVLM